MIALGGGHVEAIRAHGRRTYPEECCGVLLGHGDEPLPTVTAVREIDNVREDERRRRFLIDPRDYLAAEREARQRGLEVLGFYHSHPDHPPVPSAFDRLHAWPNLHYLILGVAGGEPGELTSWVLSEDRAEMRPERVALLPATDLAAAAPAQPPPAIHRSTAIDASGAIPREE